jgi:hypothetical protein
MNFLLMALAGMTLSIRFSVSGSSFSLLKVHIQTSKRGIIYMFLLQSWSLRAKRACQKLEGDVEFKDT